VTGTKSGGEHGVTGTKSGGGHGTTGTKSGGHGVTGAPEADGGFNFQTIMGAGIAVGDVDDDGYPDLFLNGEGLGALYLNAGKRKPGTFVESNEAWGIPPDLYDGHGVLFFDMEGDGDLDLLILRSEHPSLVLRQESGKFVDATASTGITTHRGAHVASIFDADGDGDLDIYIGYYGNHLSNMSDAPERNLPSMDGRNGSPNQLWRRGPDGTYTEEAQSMGIADTGWTLAVGAFDADMDGDLDLYVANDFGANAMFRNEGGGTFTDVTEATGTGDRGSGMNVDFADIDGDGLWDIYVTNIDMFSKRIKVVFPQDESTIRIDASLARAFQYLSGNKFYVSQSADPLSYRAEEGLRFEPGDRGWGWDAAFFDYDNDGDDDLYLTNGWISGSYAGDQTNQMFLNDDGFFYLGPAGSPETFSGNTRSTAPIDLDLDGDIDLVVNQFRQPPRVLENRQQSGHRYLRVDLRGRSPNTRAVGAVLVASAQGRRFMRHVSCGRGYLGQADIATTFGVGSAETVDLEIRWPDGSTQTLTGLPTNTSHRIEQP
jgi:enediyne biosynthesis protein E4